MILRQLVLQKGRRAIARPATSFSARQWQRRISGSSQPLYPPSQSTGSSDTFSAEDEAFLESRADPDQITANYEFRTHQRSLTSKVGADVEPHYHPKDLIWNPVRAKDITLELLLASQTHLGHKTSLWHPANARYIHGIWGEKHDSIHVIGLDVTAAHLRRACSVVSAVASRGGIILFVGTRKGHALAVIAAAQRAGAYHLFDYWKPGTLTNGEAILGRCAKKVVDTLDQEVPGFEPQLSNMAILKPDLVVCLNPLENKVLLHECGLTGVPTVGIIDTDVNPTWVTYPIPANDDSLRSVCMIAGALGSAGEEGQKLRLERAKNGRVDTTPNPRLRQPTKKEIDDARRSRMAQGKNNLDDEDSEELDFASNQVDASLMAQPGEHGGANVARMDSEAVDEIEVDENAELTDLSDDEHDLAALADSDLDLLNGLDDQAMSSDSAAGLTAEEADLLVKSNVRADDHVEEQEDSFDAQQSEVDEERSDSKKRA